MPRAKTPTNSSTPSDRSYIDAKLTDDDRAAIRQYCEEPADLWEAVSQLLDSQYVFKVAYDKQNDCYACYVSGHWLLNKPDANTTLTGRGSTWEKALRQALWIHFEKIGTDWQGWRNKKTADRNWD